VANSVIRDAIKAASSYLTEHPDEARYTDSAATAILTEGLAVTVTGPDGATVHTDMPKSVGGNGAGPSPGWLLRASQASCLATLIAMRSAQLGLEPGPIEVVIDSESDDRGILGIDELVPAGPLSARARVRVKLASGSRTELVEMISWADSHCPVQDAVRRAVPSTLEVD
jgi:organic hydroperoxide reductase OsmC/OhrA